MGQLNCVVKEIYEKQLLHKKLPNFLHPTHLLGNKKSRKKFFTLLLYVNQALEVKPYIKLYHPTFHGDFSHGSSRIPATNWAILEDSTLYVLYFALCWFPAAPAADNFKTNFAIFCIFIHYSNIMPRLENFLQLETHIYSKSHPFLLAHHTVHTFYMARRRHRDHMSYRLQFDQKHNPLRRN